MTVQRLGFLGVRLSDPDRFAATVALYRDTLGLAVIAEVSGVSTWFRLDDGTELHVYGPLDEDHVSFGATPCVGLAVANVAAVRARMEAAGIEFLWESRDDGRAAWAHYRGPDGAVYELIGPSGGIPGRDGSDGI